MARPRTVLLAVLLLVAVLPGVARAATCSQYADQAAAQRAGDTRDADGDGIYCESLPCPCSTARPGGSAARPRPPVRRRPLTGGSVLFGPRTRTRGCQVRGGLPDRACSPGARFARVGTATLCRTGYSEFVRDVSQAKKDRVFAEYGIQDHDGLTYEVDHIVPLELGGSNAIANLFPQAARPRPGFREKDALEDVARARVCDGRSRLRTLQRAIAADWITQWRRLVG